MKPRSAVQWCSTRKRRCYTRDRPVSIQWRMTFITKALVRTRASSRWFVEIGIVLAASWALAIAAQIRVQLPWSPVPLTGQTLAVALIGIAFGPRRGFTAVAAYLAQGTLGLPVFAGSASGLGILIGATGGYLVAMPFAAALAGVIARSDSRFARVLAASLLSSALILLCGTLWLGKVMQHPGTVLLMGVTPFVPGELLKGLCAAGVLRVRRPWTQ